MSDKATRKAFEADVRQRNPRYSDATIKIMLAYQFDCGWDGVNDAISEIIKDTIEEAEIRK